MSIVKPESVLEIFLQPGEMYFGDESTRIRTLLGSCISITLWHPRLRIGGMCHYMLPSRGDRATIPPDGRYADEVVALMMQEVTQAKTRPVEYEVKLFGGGNMFPNVARRKTARAPLSVAHQNIQIGRALMQKHGFKITAEQVGGNGRRHVIFDVWSGHVWVRMDKTDGAK